MRKRFYKPLYKKFNRLKINFLYRRKIFKLKKKKWQNLIFYLTKLERKKILYFYDHMLNYKPPFGFYFKNKFRLNLYDKQKLSLFFGILSKKYLKLIARKANLKAKKKKETKIYFNKNLYFIKYLESRLDIILVRSYFTLSIREARQLISHGQVYVNKKKITKKSYVVTKGDLIEINKKKLNQIKKNIFILNIINNTFPKLNMNIKTIIPKYLEINYKIFQIIIVSEIKSNKIFIHYPFWLNLNSLIKFLLY